MSCSSRKPFLFSVCPRCIWQPTSSSCALQWNTWRRQVAYNCAGNALHAQDQWAMLQQSKMPYTPRGCAVCDLHCCNQAIRSHPLVCWAHFWVHWSCTQSCRQTVATVSCIYLGCNRRLSAVPARNHYRAFISGRPDVQHSLMLIQSCRLMQPLDRAGGTKWACTRQWAAWYTSSSWPGALSPCHPAMGLHTHISQSSPTSTGRHAGSRHKQSALIGNWFSIAFPCIHH